MPELSETEIEVLKRLNAAGLNSDQIKGLDRGVNKSGFAAGGGKGGEPAPAKPKPKVKTDFQTGFGQKNFLNPGKMVQQAFAKQKSARINQKPYDREAVGRRLRGRGGGK